MLVSLCMLLALLFTLATVALVYAIITADDGYEDERGYHCAPVPVRVRDDKPSGYPTYRTSSAVPLCWFL